MFNRKFILSVATCLTLALTYGCKKENATAVDIPLDLRALYDFEEGSYWVYQHSDDSTVFDTITVTERYDCEQVMLDDEGIVAPLANLQLGLLSFPSVTMESSNQDWPIIKFGFLKRSPGDLWSLLMYVERSQDRLILDYRTSPEAYYPVDKDSVLTPQTLALPAGTFTNVLVTNQSFRWYSQYEDGTEVRIVQINLEPGVGIVRYGIETMTDFGAQTQASTLDLVAWEIK